MKTVQPLITHQSVEAHLASALDWLGWLMGLILTLGAPRRSRRLIRFVQLCERAAEAIIFLKAVGRLGLVHRRRLVRPPNAPPGFRRVAVKSRRRLLYKRARIRLRGASLYQRVLRLIAVLANPEPFAQRLAARLRRLCLRTSTMAPVAPPPWALAFAPREPMLCDDS